MNEPAQGSLRWSKGKWWGTVTALFCLQLALIWVLSDRSPDTSRQGPHRASVRLMPGLIEDARFANVLAVQDPSLLALANVRGFSGVSWLADAPPAHQLSDWAEPEAWLANDAGTLGQTFVEFVRTNEVSKPALADHPVAPALEVAKVVNPLRTRSILHVPAGWVLAAPVELPAVEHTEVLRPTVVQALVDQHGEIISARVVSSCGRPQVDARAAETDARALETARNLSLKRIAGKAAELSWVMLEFRWRTEAVEPPAVTATP
ncbi:MAG: hypothetical protein AB1705_19235 [Verrucomicrobiota bacterium]